MIEIRPAAERGLTKLPWLTSHHSFAFNQYYDPAHESFGPLRVLNDDTVAPGTGFGTHSHRDMEIVTYVLDGALEHRDSTGGHGVIEVGEVQRMTAGTGVAHSEHNASATAPVHFLQVWFLPNRRGLTPGYEQKRFGEEQRRNVLLPVASGRTDGPGVFLNQDVTMYTSRLLAGHEVLHTPAPARGAYVFVVSGTARVNGVKVGSGDAAKVSGEAGVTIAADADAELVLFDVPLR
ncbi:MAG TPA: pirin family protein [Methylomirabilota bacterium]|jgi:hypothetical protein